MPTDPREYEGLTQHEILIALDKRYKEPKNSPLHHDNRWCECKEKK